MGESTADTSFAYVALGDALNFKVTTPGDRDLAEAVLAMRQGGRHDG